MTDVPSTVEELNELIGIDWSDIPRRAAVAGDQNLAFDESGNWIRIDTNLVDAAVNDLVSDVANFQSLFGIPVGSELFPAFPGDILPANQTLYQLLTALETAIANIDSGSSASGQEDVTIASGSATLTSTPNGPVVGITSDNVPIREGTHFEVEGRVITVSSAGDPSYPLVEDVAVTWMYPTANDPSRKFEDNLIVGGQSTLNAVPQSPVVGFTADNTVIREGSHFSVDEAGVVTIGTHGTPAQPYASDGEVTWIYSTTAQATSSPDQVRGAFEYDNSDSTEIDSDAVAVVVITSDNENDTFTITGNQSTLVVDNKRQDIKTFAGAEVPGQTLSILAKVADVWRTL